MGGAGGKHAHGFIAAEARGADLQARLFFQGLVEQEQQPHVADLLQALHCIPLIERSHQFQYPTGGRGQLWLARNGELLLEAGAHEADGGNAVGHDLRSRREEGGMITHVTSSPVAPVSPSSRASHAPTGFVMDTNFVCALEPCGSGLAREGRTADFRD
ncbi:hypothetical protein D3C75_689250 [compost metagenome]